MSQTIRDFLPWLLVLSTSLLLSRVGKQDLVLKDKQLETLRYRLMVIMRSWY